MTAGWTAASAAMIALRHQQRYGEGQLVDVSAHEALTNMIRPNIAFWTYTGDPRAGRFKRGPKRALACKDGYVCVVAAQDNHWANMLRMMGNPEWAKQEMFKEASVRAEYLAGRRNELWDWARTRGTQELYHAAQRKRIQCFPVNTPEDLLNSEQLNAREFFVEVEHSQAGTLRLPGAPAKFSKTPSAIKSTAPMLGQHYIEVFIDRLRLAPERLAELAQVGII